MPRIAPMNKFASALGRMCGRRCGAALGLGLSAVGCLYALYRSGQQLLRGWRTDWIHPQSRSTLLQQGGKLACYAAAALLLAALSGWLWKTGRLRVPKGLRGWVAAVLLCAAWIAVARGLCRKWYALAHDNVTSDAVLIALALVLLGLLWLGLLAGLGRTSAQRTAPQDRWCLAAVLALWCLIVFAAKPLRSGGEPCAI